MRRAWFQAHPHDPLRDHYDVTDRLRDEAIAHGAVAVTWRQAARTRRQRRSSPAPVRSASGSTLVAMTATSTAPPPHDIAAALLVLGAATLGESGGRTMRPRIRAVWKGATLSAPAYPVRCTPGDNLAIHVAVTKAPPGHALVVDVGDQEEFRLLGRGPHHRGPGPGSGRTRSSTAGSATSPPSKPTLPVFSTTVALRGAAKTGRRLGRGLGPRGRRRGPQAGDWVVGDADGVTVIPGPTRVDDVLAAGRARAEKEDGLFAALTDGATTVELLDLDTSPVDVV